MSLAVLGDCVLDVYAFYDDLKHGFNESKGPVLLEPGGACNVAIAASRGGVEVRVVDLVGDDAAGRALREALLSAGINVEGLRLAGSLHTPVSINLISEKRGTHKFLGHLPRQRELPRPGPVNAVFLDGYAAISSNAASLAMEMKGSAKVFFDPGPLYRGSEGLAALEAADYVLLNLSEYRRLRGLLKGKTAVVKMGPRGAAIYSNGFKAMVKGIKVRPLTTVGAGDAFDGYFISAILRGLDPRKALEVANEAAARKITGVGISSFPRIQLI